MTYRDDARVVTVGRRAYSFTVRSPVAPVAGAGQPALLLAASGRWENNLNVEPYRFISDAFLAAGHHVVSSDLPNHGALVDGYGEGLTGIAAALAAGVDLFARHVDATRAVVDECVARGLAPSGRIVVSGVSRGALFALHVMAADGRIGAGVGFAPVTFLPALREFSELGDAPLVRQSNALRLVPRLSGRPLCLIINQEDPRVGTPHCLDLCSALRAEQGTAGLTLRLTEGTTHRLPDDGFRWGAQWLLNWLQHPSHQPPTRTRQP